MCTNWYCQYVTQAVSKEVIKKRNYGFIGVTKRNKTLARSRRVCVDSSIVFAIQFFMREFTRTWRIMYPSTICPHTTANPFFISHSFNVVRCWREKYKVRCRVHLQFSRLKFRFSHARYGDISYKFFISLLKLFCRQQHVSGLTA